jgi:hypothetical protein
MALSDRAKIRQRNRYLCERIRYFRQTQGTAFHFVSELLKGLFAPN